MNPSDTLLKTVQHSIKRGLLCVSHRCCLESELFRQEYEHKLAEFITITVSLWGYIKLNSYSDISRNLD
jgi:hypothetical protein